MQIRAVLDITPMHRTLPTSHVFPVKLASTKMCRVLTIAQCALLECLLLLLEWSTYQTAAVSEMLNKSMQSTFVLFYCF